MFDLCAMTGREMMALVSHALKKDREGRIAPLVAIGHPKGFRNEEELSRFFSRAQGYVKKNLIRFVTFSEFLDDWAGLVR